MQIRCGLVDRYRMNDMRRDHHHQLILALVQSVALEQLAENRNIADTRNLLKLLGHAVVHQPGDRETLSVGKTHFRLDAIRRQRRNHKALQCQRVGEIQRADFGLDLQVNQAIRSQGRA